jgi:hypothetical protein
MAKSLNTLIFDNVWYITILVIILFIAYMYFNPSSPLTKVYEQVQTERRQRNKTLTLWVSNLLSFPFTSINRWITERY